MVRGLGCQVISLPIRSVYHGVKVITLAGRRLAGAIGLVRGLSHVTVTLVREASYQDYRLGWSVVGRGYHLGRRLVVSSYHLGSRGRSPRLSSWSVGRLIETIVSVRVSGHQGYHLGHWVGSTNLSSWGVGRVAKATASVSWPLCQNCRCILLIQSPKLSSWLAGGGPRLSPWPEARRINYYLGSRGCYEDE